MSRILLVDDDVEFCQLLKEFFELEGMEVKFAHDGAAGIDAILAGDSDVVVLDIMMPGPDGIEVLKAVRETSTIPIIMLTARGEDVDRIIGLELGADDYLPKPCNPRELLARIRALLRRTKSHSTNGSPVLKVDNITLNAANRTIEVNDTTIELTSTQFDVLKQLMKNAGTVLSKESLMETVLGRKLEPYDRSLDMHVSNIRKVLFKVTGKQYIKTIRSVGYQFVVEAE